MSYARNEKHIQELRSRMLGNNNPAKRDDIKKKISEANKGRIPWNKGTKKPMPLCIDCGKSLKDSRSSRCRGCVSRIVMTGRPNKSKGIKRPETSGENNPNWGGGKEVLDKKWAEKRRFWCLRRHARKMNAEGSHTITEWEDLKKMYDHMCLCCKQQEPDIKLTEDHIVPLIKGGTDNIDNIQPLCMQCNSIKHTKVIDYRIKELIIN